MNLARMMTDRFFVEDREGKRSGPFRTKFGSGTLMVFQDSFDAKEGDRVIQLLPDGSERIHVVASSTFNSGSRNIPGHFSLQVSELATEQAATPEDFRKQPALVIAPEVAVSMQALAQAIECADFPIEQKNEAGALLRALLAHPVVAAVLANAGQAA